MKEKSFQENIRELFLKKKYQELVSKIENYYKSNNKPPGLSNLSGVCKVLMKNSLDEYGIHGKYFYFNHSFYLNHSKKEKKNVKYTSNFKRSFPALVKKGSFIGTAFHPEKSQKNGEYFISKILNYVKT